MNLRTEGQASVSVDREDAGERALLRIDYDGNHCVIDPREAVRIRDGLRREESQDAMRLATLIDAKATELLAAPLYAGTVSVRLDRGEAEQLTMLLAEWREDGSTGTDVGQLWDLLSGA